MRHVNTNDVFHRELGIQQQTNRMIAIRPFDLGQLARLLFQVNMQFQSALVRFRNMALHLVPRHGPKRVHTSLHGLTRSQHALQLIKSLPIPMESTARKSLLSDRKIHTGATLFVGGR